MSKSRRLFFVLNNAEEILLVAFIATTVILIFVQVVMRYVFNHSLAWTEELARYLFIWESWIGISIGAKRGKHIKIELLTNVMKGKPLAFVLTLADLFTLFFIVVLIYYGAELTDKVLAMTTRSSALRIPMWMIYASLPVGCGFMGIRVISDIIVRLRPRGGEIA
jgi:TRAP-type C4-dicarboxylate transport system permease small subunit